MIGVCVLGSTGSIGVSTLDVLARFPDTYRVTALTAHRDLDTLYRQCLRLRPAYAVMVDPAGAARLRERLEAAGLGTEVIAGPDGLSQVATLPETDYVMAAIVGAAGLLPALAAARAGKRIMLANKEALVMAGRLFMDEVCRHGAELLPIDSEHNAIFQCLPGDYRNGLSEAGVRRILLTSSGGPFRTRPLRALREVEPEEACAHPNWVMGQKISVDSATMMNKGLEVIEACLLFDAEPDRVDVLVHPQSVVHSMVEFVDGSVLAQLAAPDMRVPIAHALAWPRRMTSGARRLDLVRVGRLDFEPPDEERFPCLALAYAAARAGGTLPAIMNAANEMAVAAFLGRRIRFTDIAPVISDTMDAISAGPITDLESILGADALARQCAAKAIGARVGQGR